MRCPVVVVGAGQAGLSTSHHLTARAIDHIVLERGRVAHSWRTERWDSLTLLTPNWMTRLPGLEYRGAEPDGYMSSAELIRFLDAYAGFTRAPVREGVEVRRVGPNGDGLEVVTDDERISCDAVVLATGASSSPHLPACAGAIDGGIRQLGALEYRNPEQLDPGEVLVVGASASGVQIADELQRNDRQVTLAVGGHVRLLRTYRGHDIHWWMDRIGQFDERYDEVDDVERARRVPSAQLIGSHDRRTLDLNALSSSGVQLVGRLMAINGGKLQFSGGIGAVIANADLKQHRLLDRIDEHVALNDVEADVDEPDRPEPTVLGRVPTELNLHRFATIVWATGHRPSYPWLDPSALDRRGRVVHDGGVGAMPGLYLLGLPFLRRRRSSFLAGVGADSADLVSHLHAHLDRRGRR